MERFVAVAVAVAEAEPNADWGLVYLRFPEPSDPDETMVPLQVDPDAVDLLFVFLLRVLRTARG